MVTVLLGVAGALAYGAADFLGGLGSRRLRAITVSAVAAVAGLLPLLVGLALIPSRYSTDAVLGGLAAGACGAIGVVLLYAVLAIGPMSVLSPLTAVFAAIVPVVVGLARGTVLSPLAVLSLIVAIVAVVLVAAVRDRSGARLTVRGVVAAVVAGTAFGGLVLAYDATPADSGVAPLIVARVLQTVVLGGAAIATGMLARRQMSPATSDRGAWGPALVATLIGCGIFDAGANVFIQAGLHSSIDPSTLPTMSVLNALYPVGTILLAGLLLRERLTAVQTVGIVLAVAASVGLAVS